MFDSYKPGGGDRLQPFIPAGNGKISGEYTFKNYHAQFHKDGILNCNIKNKRYCYNYYNSRLVKKVTMTYIARNGASIPSTYEPNSVAKKIVNGYIVSERYYNENGEAYLDIDYTCHGNPKNHPCVPHIHKWKKDENGNLIRGKWEDFE